MNAAGIQRVVIVGGGTAGWMAAASLAKALAPFRCEILLIESDEIGTVGVGEATIPPMMDFIRALGIDEDELIRETQATFKLGIEFRNWTRLDHAYYHPFGNTGFDMHGVPFQSYWRAMRKLGRAGVLEEYSLQAAAAARGKFMRPIEAPSSPLESITYALHFDASLFARYLRGYSEARGVTRLEGKVEHVALRPADGFIEAVTLTNDVRVGGDLFIDCTGFIGLLIEGALKTGYNDWSAWLPCNRAVAVPCARTGPLSSHTVATARDGGWQWRIPLQHRVGNGYVYCSDFVDDTTATEALLSTVEGDTLADPKLLRFTTGHRRKFWNKNCVALGLASGFLEPLESTSIHLIQRGIALLLKMFPDRAFDPSNTARYNDICAIEYQHIRDFLLLHYVTTERTDTAFWRQMAAMPLPESLSTKIELFKGYGRLFRAETDLFPDQSWMYILAGQNITPHHDDPLVSLLNSHEVAANLANIREVVARCADAMPTHADFLLQITAGQA